MLEALVQNNAQNAIFGIVKDSDVAAMAHEAGVGAEFETDLGGQADLPGVIPFHGRFKVEVVNDGVYQTTGPVAQGKMHNVGKSALLSIGGVKVAVASERVQAHDPLCLRAFRRRLTRPRYHCGEKAPLTIAPISTQLRRRPSPPSPPAGMVPTRSTSPIKTFAMAYGTIR